jgi:hypothetical protein
MVCFQAKNPNLDKFWRAFDWKMFIYLMAIWNILLKFGIFYDRWYILYSFGSFFRFGHHVPIKIWQPWPQPRYRWPQIGETLKIIRLKKL